MCLDADGPRCEYHPIPTLLERGQERAGELTALSASIDEIRHESLAQR